MGDNFHFDIKPFLKKNEELISINEITTRMKKFFSCDKCSRTILSNLENKYVTIYGYYERFGYKYTSSMSVQESYIILDGVCFKLGHMWWQNVKNSNFLNSSLINGCLVEGKGIVNVYKNNDIEFPCDQSYGLNNVEISCYVK